MKVRSSLSVVVLAAAMGLPALSMASTVVHPDASDVGYTLRWDHFTSTKTRAQVTAEYQAALKDGSLRAMQLASLGFFTPTQSTKTREQVRQELFSMTPAERAALDASYRSN